MKSTTTTTDMQSLIGESIAGEYLHQSREQELMLADATDDDAWEGYEAFSAELEESAWTDASEVEGVLIKRACEHSTCSHFQCSKSTRIGGIEI